MASISGKVLPVLQLTRLALVFTAIADSGCELMLRAGRTGAMNGQSVWSQMDAPRWLLMGLTSFGLYGMGMSLNDIIDQRRDRQLSPNRPLPSGRIGVRTAHVVCAILAAIALAAGGGYAALTNTPFSFVLVFFTMALITFYDFAGKYLVAPGLLTLGLIRFFQATIAAPNLPVLWHPLLLLNHVAIVSMVAYEWEGKRPALRAVHRASIYFGLIGIDALATGMVLWRRIGRDPSAPATELLNIQPELILPAMTVALFILVAVWIRRRSPNSRTAGQTLMLSGLLWLIIYDAAFVTAFVGPLPGLMLGLLLPIAYLSVRVMRAWSVLLTVSQRPEFKRIDE